MEEREMYGSWQMGSLRSEVGRPELLRQKAPTQGKRSCSVFGQVLHISLSRYKGKKAQ